MVKSLEDTGLLVKSVSQTVWNDVKQQKGGFLSMLAVALSASLLENMSARNWRQGVIKDGEGTIRADQDF